MELPEILENGFETTGKFYGTTEIYMKGNQRVLYDKRKKEVVFIYEIKRGCCK